MELSCCISHSISLFLKIIPRTNIVKAFEISNFFKSKSFYRPTHKSKEGYSNFFKNQFCLLANGKTVIGHFGDLLKTEDITRKEIRGIIDQKESENTTMIFNQNLNSLLVGVRNGCLFQYGRNLFGDFKKQKEYGKVGVGVIIASDWSGNFAVVGGRNGKISLIDMTKREVIAKGITTAIGEVFSLQFCRVSRNQMYLAVGGKNNDYSNSKTDFFDVSGLFNLRGNLRRNGKIIKKKLIKKMESITEKIKELE